LQLGRGIGAEFYTLADALVLGAIHEGERAVRAGAVGARAGVVGEDGALGGGELVAGGAGVDGVGGGAEVDERKTSEAYESLKIDTKANIV
jgi:hypothetical protein